MTTHILNHARFLRVIPEGTFIASDIGAQNNASFLRGLYCRGMVKKAGKIQDYKGDYVNSWQATEKFWQFKARYSL